MCFSARIAGCLAQSVGDVLFPRSRVPTGVKIAGTIRGNVRNKLPAGIFWPHRRIEHLPTEARDDGPFTAAAATLPDRGWPVFVGEADRIDLRAVVIEVRQKEQPIVTRRVLLAR